MHVSTQTTVCGTLYLTLSYYRAIKIIQIHRFEFSGPCHYFNVLTRWRLIIIYNTKVQSCSGMTKVDNKKKKLLSQSVSVQQDFVFATSSAYIQLVPTQLVLTHTHQGSTVRYVLRCAVSGHVFLQRGQCQCDVWEPCSLLGDEWPHSVSLCLLDSNRGHWAASVASWENVMHLV